MGDVAERILVLIELAVFRHVDAPALDILAVVIARRQPQRLDHGIGRLRVAIDGFMGDLKAHSRRQESGNRNQEPGGTGARKPA
jgi:hypothetical protein